LAAAFAFNVSLFVARPLLRQGLGVFGEPNVSLSELEEFETLGGVGCPPDCSETLPDLRRKYAAKSLCGVASWTHASLFVSALLF